MEATSTETTRFCPMCAAPMRPRAVFCHRCGKPYPEEAKVVLKANESSGSENVPTTKEFEDQWNTLTNNNSASEAVEIKNLNPVMPAPETGIEEDAAEKLSGKQEKNEKNRRVRRRVVQTTEYVWEEPASDPTWRFVLATVIVLVFACLILWFGGFIHF